MVLAGEVPDWRCWPSGPALGDGASVAEAVRGYLDHLLVERGLAANTLTSYRRDLTRYAQVLAAAGRTGIGQVTQADIASYLARLREGDEDHPPLAASSAGRAMAAVRGLHAYVFAQGLTAADPARPVPPPAPPRRLPKAISVAEVERLLDAAGPGDGGDPRPVRDRALLEFLYATGARISEATGLDVDDLELDGESAVLLDGKGGKQRIVPLGRYAAAALDAYLVRSRPALAAGRHPLGRPGPVPQRPRRPADPAGGLGRAARRRRPGRAAAGVPAHPAALVRHPSARRRGGHPGRTGTAGARLGDHDPGVHPGDGRETA